MLAIHPKFFTRRLLLSPPIRHTTTNEGASASVPDSVFFFESGQGYRGRVHAVRMAQAMRRMVLHSRT